MMVMKVSELEPHEKDCLCSHSLCSGKRATGKVTLTCGITHYFCSARCFALLVGRHPEKRFVTRFQPDQGTPSSPGGAPQRKEYNNDRYWFLACKRYEAEWLQLYDCRDPKLSPDGCGDPNCPRCGTIQVAEKPPEGAKPC